MVFQQKNHSVLWRAQFFRIKFSYYVLDAYYLFVSHQHLFRTAQVSIRIQFFSNRVTFQSFLALNNFYAADDGGMERYLLANQPCEIFPTSKTHSSQVVLLSFAQVSRYQRLLVLLSLH